MEKVIYKEISPGYVILETNDCKARGKKHKLSLLEKRAVVFIRNRRLNGRDFRSRRRYTCVLKKNKYYLARYSVYKCSVCGKEVYAKKSQKRITKEEALKSGLKMLPFFTLPRHDM